MKYCQRCVYPMRAVNTLFDREGICSACRAAEEMSKVADDDFWKKRREVFEQLIEQYRRGDVPITIALFLSVAERTAIGKHGS